MVLLFFASCLIKIGLIQIWIWIVTIYLLAVGLCASSLIAQVMYISIFIYMCIYGFPGGAVVRLHLLV